MAAGMYQGGHPPGILSKESEGTNESLPKDQEKSFREHYVRKYLTNPEDIKVPVFTMGKVNFTKIGYDSMRDMQVIEMSEHGVRVLCRILGVPSVLFGDNSNSTYNNVSEATVALWEDFLVPEIDSFYEGLSQEILPAYGEGLEIKPIYDNIPALQGDREKATKVYSAAFDRGAYTPNEFREKLGDDRVEGKPELDEHYISANMFPLSEGEEITEEEEEKFYNDNDLKDKL